MNEFSAGWAAVSTLALLVSGLIGAELNRFCHRPRVVLEYEKSIPHYRDDGINYSIVISNKGRKAAEKVIGLITIECIKQNDLIEKDCAKDFEDLPSYKDEGFKVPKKREQFMGKNAFRGIDREHLCWARAGNPYEIDIHPGSIQALDVFKQQKDNKGSWYYIFPSEKGWRILRTRIRRQNLKGVIHLCPANEFPETVNFSIEEGKDGCLNFTLFHDKIKFGIAGHLIRHFAAIFYK